MNCLIGSGFPISIQTMWKDKLTSIDSSVLKRIENLQELGCDILRFACPSIEEAEILGKLSQQTSMPIVADIHFDHKLALLCLDYPIAKIRINPGNIGDAAKVKAVVEKAKDKGVPIRIGVNGGSLPKDLLGDDSNEKIDRVSAVIKAAEREVAVFEALNFKDVIVSMKASSVEETILVNQRFAEKHDYPLHLGVTEAGPLVSGIVKNTAALYTLLKAGIGNTIRVSLSDTMENEVLAGREIVKAAMNTKNGIDLVSCPRCGRAGFDTHGFTARNLDRIMKIKKDLTVAVMGCVVNGPGEAKHADLGITGAGDKILIFKHGEIIRTVNQKDADTAFIEELLKL